MTQKADRAASGAGGASKRTRSTGVAAEPASAFDAQRRADEPQDPAQKTIGEPSPEQPQPTRGRRFRDKKPGMNKGQQGDGRLARVPNIDAEISADSEDLETMVDVATSLVVLMPGV